jgi:hypothetical protein
MISSIAQTQVSSPDLSHFLSGFVPKILAASPIFIRLVFISICYHK